MKSGASIASPCVEVCSIDEAHGQCSGCFRTLDEIASWRAYSPAQRAAVMAEIERRRAAYRNTANQHKEDSR
jgi:uncharacterized protein